MKWDRLGATVCIIIVLLLMAGMLAYGLYRLALANTSHGVAVIWALVELPLIPLAALAGYKLGGTEARGVLAGIGLGTGPVVQTAEKIADVKAGAVQKIKAPEPWVVELPRMVDVTPKRLPGDDDQVVM